MFRGFSSVSLDSKGRLAIPSRFRERLMGIAGGCLVQTLNPLDRSLWLYPLPEWELIEEKLAELSDFDKQSRRAKQMMRGYATDCQLDTHGRNPGSRRTAQLRPTRQADHHPGTGQQV